MPNKVSLQLAVKHTTYNVWHCFQRSLLTKRGRIANDDFALASDCAKAMKLKRSWLVHWSDLESAEGHDIVGVEDGMTVL